MVLGVVIRILLVNKAVFIKVVDLLTKRKDSNQKRFGFI